MSIVVGDTGIFDYPAQINLGYLTGAQPVWADGDDATFSTGFATLRHDGALATIMYAPLTGSANGTPSLTVTVRALWGIANSGTQATGALIYLLDSEPATSGGFSDYLASEAIDGSGLGVIEDVSAVFNTTSVNPPHSWSEVLTTLSAGDLWVAVSPAFPDAFGNNNGMTVYELSVVGAPSRIPIRRQYPVPATRVYPRPPFQSSGRSGSAAIL